MSGDLYGGIYDAFLSDHFPRVHFSLSTQQFEFFKGSLYSMNLYLLVFFSLFAYIILSCNFSLKIYIHTIRNYGFRFKYTQSRAWKSYCVAHTGRLLWCQLWLRVAFLYRTIAINGQITILICLAARNAHIYLRRIRPHILCSYIERTSVQLCQNHVFPNMLGWDPKKKPRRSHAACIYKFSSGNRSLAFDKSPAKCNPRRNPEWLSNFWPITQSKCNGPRSSFPHNFIIPIHVYRVSEMYSIHSDLDSSSHINAHTT